MSEFLQYLPNVFTSTNLLVLSLGTIGGLILGAAPGLSPTMAVALLVPFTFHMDSVSGLILLGSVYTATVARGALSAILEKIPGAPAIIDKCADIIPKMFKDKKVLKKMNSSGSPVKIMNRDQVIKTFKERQALLKPLLEEWRK